MNITVYLGALEGNDPALGDAVRDVGVVQPVLQAMAILLTDAVYKNQAAHGTKLKRHVTRSFIFLFSR